MWRLTLLLCFLFFPLPLAAEEALSAKPILVAEMSRLYSAPKEVLPEQTVPVNEAGSELRLTYSSEVPLTVQVSYPFQNSDGEMTYNPLHSIVLENAPSGMREEVTIDLTVSPAWSLGRDQYLLQIKGAGGSTILVHEMYIQPATVFASVRVFFHQLFIDEPVILSSVNYLWGYRVLDTSVSVILGGLMFVTGLLVIGYWLLVKKKNQIFWRALIFMPLLFLLLYDARFSFDLLRLSANDAHSWFGSGEYRQLGSIPAIADFLQAEGKKTGAHMSVEICTDGTDLGQKQLRYMLYPTPVRRVQKGLSTATHLVLIDTLQKPGEDNMIDCGGGSRVVQLLSSFAHEAEVFRYHDIPF